MGRKKLEINSKTADRLKKLFRDYPNKTGKELAVYLHSTPQQISYYRNGIRGMDTDTARMLVKFFSPDIRFQWLLGEDDAKTDKDVVLEELKETYLYLLRRIDIDSFVETFVVMSAPGCGYIFENRTENLSHDMLYKKRGDHLVQGMDEPTSKKPESSQRAFDDLINDQADRINELLDFPEEYNIIKDSEIVARCTSKDIETMSNKMCEYLGYLIYKYVEFYRTQHGNASSNSLPKKKKGDKSGQH